MATQKEQADAFATMMLAKTHEAAEKAVETYAALSPKGYDALVSLLGKEIVHTLLRGMCIRGIHIGAKMMTDMLGLPTPPIAEL
jgi:hypothetical protein